MAMLDFRSSTSLTGLLIFHAATAAAPAMKKLPKLGENLSGDEEYSDDGDGESDDDKAFNDEVKRNYKMNKRDEEAFEAFMNNSGPRRTLADIIREKTHFCSICLNKAFSQSTTLKVHREKCSRAGPPTNDQQIIATA